MAQAGGPRDGDPIDEGAVPAARVPNDPSICGSLDHGVACGDVEVRFRVELEVGFRVATEGDDVALE